ncbi:hypothetical protein ACFQ6N_24840 [Kitasatospora sp. NPDC056446]|uniref:hypothetical protein n=1 Tax=Kitasatospora sp. NPDC056446 TaxID=3345819 RepID=UPI0036BA5F0F
MKRAIATFATTGLLTVATLVGTAASAGAATPVAASAQAVSFNPIGSDGPFNSLQECTNYVASHGRLGVWDCESALGHWWSLSPWTFGQNAVDTWGPFGSAQECISWVGSVNKLGVFDCEAALGKWYAFAP